MVTYICLNLYCSPLLCITHMCQSTVKDFQPFKSYDVEGGGVCEMLQNTLRNVNVKHGLNIHKLLL